MNLLSREVVYPLLQIHHVIKQNIWIVGWQNALTKKNTKCECPSQPVATSWQGLSWVVAHSLIPIGPVATCDNPYQPVATGWEGPSRYLNCFE